MEPDSLERYSRQVRFAPLGEAGQRALLGSRVVVCGLGALGSASAHGLARAGIGFLRVVDRDFLELNNLQRQTLYDEDDVADQLPKAEAAARKLRKINSTIAIEPIVADLHANNIERLAGDVDLLIDGTDNFETRFLLNDFAIKHEKPWVYGACVGAEGRVMSIAPGRTPCLRCVIEDPPPPGTTASCETAGVLGAVATAVASFQLAEAIKILTGQWDAVNKCLLAFDLWENRFQRLGLQGLKEASSCPACQGRRFDWLEGSAGAQTTRLCGRNAVQVAPAANGSAVDWSALKTRLEGVGPVYANRFLMRCAVDGRELTIFPDGRAIIKGVDDVAQARSLYARYVGG